MRTKVGIILINYNCTTLTIECVKSINQMNVEKIDVEVLIIDNGSENGEKEKLGEIEGVKTIYEKNLGFAGANNLGIKYFSDRVDYIWILNNDTEVEEDALNTLLDLAKGHNNFYFFGSYIGFYNTNKIWYGGGKLDMKYLKAQHERFNAKIENTLNESQETDWITGCSLLISVSSLKFTGLLDNHLFLYKEDLEWQIRNQNKSIISNKVLVWHKVSSSTGGSEGDLGHIFMIRNQWLLMKRYGISLLRIFYLAHLSIFRPLLKRDFKKILLIGEIIRSTSRNGSEIVQRNRPV